jgi:hypothetical protein
MIRWGRPRKRLRTRWNARVLEGTRSIECQADGLYMFWNWRIDNQEETYRSWDHGSGAYALDPSHDVKR